MKKIRVFVASYAGAAINMFSNYPQYKIVEDLRTADLVQYMGGGDISSSLYGEEQHRSNWPDPVRDDYEVEIFQEALKRGIPQAGICRGLQLFCALNGGKLYQDMDNHSVGGTHQCYDVRTEEIYPVSSTHHQSIRPDKNTIVIAIAYGPGPISTYKEIMEGARVVRVEGNMPDIEAAWFPKLNAFGVQGHPEYPHVRKCTEMYFQYLEYYLFGSPKVEGM